MIQINRGSTCPLVFGCWEMSHVIFLKLKKEIKVALSQKMLENFYIGNINIPITYYVK